MCAVEVGLAVSGTAALTIAGGVNKWPEMIGELLASMYFFGTLNYLNNLCHIPDSIMWTTYGVLAVRSTGCIVLQMILDTTGCHVQLLHKSGVLSLGSAIEYVVDHISTT